MNQRDINELQRAAVQSIHDNWMFFLVEGIILAVLGLVAIALPPIATFAVEITVGVLFLISGVVGLILTFWMRQAPGFWWSLLSAALALAAGIVLLGWPLAGILSLTYLLIIFFLAEGILTIMFALDHKRELSGRWGWMLASGIVDLVLAAIVIAGLPGTAAWAIGLIVGINMLFGGVSMIAMALHARSIASGAPTTS
jgi:uncharacterized membrane protein HdeD (DUF308 family)